MERCLNILYVKMQKVSKAPEPEKPKASVYLQPLNQSTFHRTTNRVKSVILKKLEEE